MRISILSLLFFLFSFSLSAQEPEGTKWHQFWAPTQAIDVAETRNEIWFSLQDHIIRVDKVTGSISFGGVPDGLGFNSSVEQVWVDADDRPHLLIGNSRIASFTEEAWVTEDVPILFGIYNVEEIIARSSDNNFLLRGENVDLFRWQIGNPVVRAADLEQAAPWRIERTLYAPLYNRYWVSQGAALGYIKDGVFISISLPAEAGSVLEFQLDRNQEVWVRTENMLLRRKGEEWAKHYLPENLTTEEIRFTTLGAGAAMVASPEGKYFLRPSDNWFTRDDYSEKLQSLSWNRPFIFDETGTLWWIDEAQNTVSRWREGEDIEHLYPEFWLPFAGKVDHLISDQSGRIWVTGNFASYFYANQRWWKGEKLYPNFPDSVKQVAFNNECAPVVIRSSDTGNFNTRAELLMYYNNEWKTLSDNRIANPTLFSGISRLRFDRDNHLLVQNGFLDNYQIWAYQHWSTFLAIDFFPAPSNIYDLVIKDNQEVYLLTDIGIFINSGQNYQHIPLEDIIGESGPSFYGQIRYSPEGTLWMFHNRQIIRWQNDIPEEIAFVLDTDLLPTLRFFDFFINMNVFSDNNIWFTSNDFGIIQYDGLQTTHFHTDNSGLFSDYIQHLAQDDRGRIWVTDNNRVAVMTLPDHTALPLITTATKDNLHLSPNPACCQTQVSWQQDVAGKTSLQLYNIQGQPLQTILNTELDAGTHTATVQRNDLPAGIYYLILDQLGERQTQKILWK